MTRDATGARVAALTGVTTWVLGGSLTRDATGARVAALTGVTSPVLGGCLTRDVTGIPRWIGTGFR